jgi:hypothetical protein
MINLVEALVSHKYQPEDNIVVEGDPGDLCFIIEKGSVKCTKEGNFIRNMS